MKVFYGCLYYAALRPSEAVMLRELNLYLPAQLRPERQAGHRPLRGPLSVARPRSRPAVRAKPTVTGQRPAGKGSGLAPERAASRLAREVNVTIRSPAWWREGTDGFHADVMQRPLVPLFSAEGAG